MSQSDVFAGRFSVVQRRGGRKVCSAFLHLSVCLGVSPVGPEVSRSSPFSSPDLDLVHRQVMASTGRSLGTLSRKCLD